ncbi:DUF3581 family protein [Thalassotalea aquiviva]|uniref:DUF3581 family protein n=1 Tax=Thalassotalea aquiviva TaxID=3242415 RepID=UPI003529EEA7
MFIEQYYCEKNQKVSFTREQASDFAKNVCDDFNPIHDIDAKRFCVPGDLLFAIILSKIGLSQHMTFQFKGMVTEGIELNFPTQSTKGGFITDDKEKEYLCFSQSGEHSQNENLVTSLIRSYVEFSGHTFPYILGDLMEKNKVMINPARPMVMYESMEIHLEHFAVKDVSLKLNEQETQLTVDGKRGQAKLFFDLISNGEVVGHGIKFMLLSGLKPYCKNEMQALTTQFFAMKNEHYTTL